MSQIRNCKYCHQNFDITVHPKGWMANHVRWCHDNPKRNLYKNNGKQLNTPESRVKAIAKIKKAHADGRYKYDWMIRGRKWTDAQKKKHSENALKLNYRRKCKSTVEYVCKNRSVVKLDSSWEVKVATKLDEFNVEWVRPEPIIWIDNNKRERYYFSDFYLPAYDIYIDPKNPYVMKQQHEKISWLRENIKNVFFLENTKTIEDLTLTTLEMWSKQATNHGMQNGAASRS